MENYVHLYACIYSDNVDLVCNVCFNVSICCNVCRCGLCVYVYVGVVPQPDTGVCGSKQRTVILRTLHTE